MPGLNGECSFDINLTMAATSWNGEILPDSRSYSYMHRKPRQGIHNSKPENVGVRPLKCTTSITYQAMVIFIISMGLFGKATSFELHTERSVKVVRGRNTSLICSFTDPADAVYWYKHNSTGAPDDDAEIVAREYLGISYPVPGIERFRITEDYRLLISDVSIADETTYSCVVVPQTGETTRGYTDLRIIVLADSDGPRIDPCNTFVAGECTYNFPTDPPEEVVFVCELCGVRPLVNLEWVRSDDRVMEQALGPLTIEKDGLYDVVSILKIPKSGFDYYYSCQATGDAVNNVSSTKVTFEEGTVHDGSRSWQIALAVCFPLSSMIAIVLLVLLICRTCKNFRLPRLIHTQGEVKLHNGLVSKSDSFSGDIQGYHRSFNTPAKCTFDDNTDLPVKDILETFISTQLHPWKDRFAALPNYTIVVCRITSQDHSTSSVVIRGNISHVGLERVHPEMVLLDEIEKMAIPVNSEIKMFLTYSPCKRSTTYLLGTNKQQGRLLALRRKYPKVDMTFSGLYKIRLPTCDTCGCCMCPSDDEALKNLMVLGASPMEKKDWDELIELLTEYDKEMLKRDETHTLTDLNDIRYGEEYGDWRDWEDKRMMDGYEEMKDKLLSETPPGFDVKMMSLF